METNLIDGKLMGDLRSFACNYVTVGYEYTSATSISGITILKIQLIE